MDERKLNILVDAAEALAQSAVAKMPPGFTAQIIEASVFHIAGYCTLVLKGGDASNYILHALVDKRPSSFQNDYFALRDLMMGALREMKDEGIISRENKLTTYDMCDVIAGAMLYRHGNRDAKDPRVAVISTVLQSCADELCSKL
jgi:hypothetical protein